MAIPARGAAEIDIRLLGEFGVFRGPEPVPRAALGSRKARVLLQVLAVERAGVVPVWRLIGILWGDRPPEHAAENVATLVSRLRRELGGSIVEGGRAGYRLGVARVDLDVARGWIEEADARFAAAEPGLAVAVAARGLDILARGPVAVDDPDADWAEPARGQRTALLTRGRRLLAEAALDADDPVRARRAAEAAVADDPYDEAGTRLLMRALQAAGEPARALAVYARLRELLVAELGADPAPDTEAVHLAVLRGVAPLRATPLPAVAVRSGAHQADEPWSESPTIVGRQEELRVLRAAWNDAAAGSPSMVLIAGEAGIGKTSVSDAVVRAARVTGGTVLHARCYETERSLFLQPLIEAIGSAVQALSPDVVLAAAGDAGPVLAGLVPDAAAVLGPPLPPGHSPAELRRRRAFEAVTGFIRRLAAGTPVLLVLDDLQNAGLATVEGVHYLARHLRGSRVLAVATVRTGEGETVLEALAEVTTRLDLGPLAPATVLGLAAAAGQAELADQILRRTGGHALFVVETLRGLLAGEDGVPRSLQAAVLSRVRRAGRGVEELLRAGAVLGASFDPGTAARVLGQPAQLGVTGGEAALAARLLVASGRDYEFANDLIREVLYASTPAPTRLAYHRCAADLLTSRPEAVAAHASAAGDWPRAARAWLLAGEEALRRFAVDDAEQLLSRCLDSASRAGDREVRGRALLARARARAERAAYGAAIVDLEEAVLIAQQIGDQRLEMVALRALGGEAPMALGRPSPHLIIPLHRGLRIATALGDRAMEADFLAWLAVLASNSLRFDEAIDDGRRAVAAARASGDAEALVAALDGRKTSLAYLGEVDELRPVLDELLPLLRRSGDPFRLQWALFESGFPAVAAGDWPAATAAFADAREVSRRGGFRAYESWHVAHLGWLARLQGDLAGAVALGRAAIALTEQLPHAWNAAVSAAQLGMTLAELGESAEAVRVLERGRVLAERDGSEAYLLRCLAPLAEVTGSPDVLAEADASLARIATPAGSAWLAGDGAYLGVARAWLARGEPARAREVLAPLLAAARRVPWVAALAAGCLVDGRAADALGRREEARELFVEAAGLAGRFRLVRVAEDAATALRDRAALR